MSYSEIPFPNYLYQAYAQRVTFSSGMNNHDSFQTKLAELTEELRKHGLWKANPPQWVERYSDKTALVPPDFFEWLQFVYLPNLYMLRTTTNFSTDGNYIMLKARDYMKQNSLPESVVRIMVELDNIANTNEKKFSG